MVFSPEIFPPFRRKSRKVDENIREFIGFSKKSEGKPD